MDAKLRIFTEIQAYQDSNPSNNPQKRYFDWKVDYTNDINNPASNKYSIPASSSLTLFSGTRSTSIDTDTEWTLTLSPLASNRYRMTWTAGTAPELRTDRGIDLDTLDAVLTLNSNLTLTFEAPAGEFTGVQVGDTLFIPGTSTGDSATVFNPLNEGYWVVLAIDNTSSILQLTRPTGETFQGASEDITVTDTSQVQVFSSAGVQVGDGVSIAAGFSSPVLGEYEVAAVNPGWFEIVTDSPLPIDVTAVPGTTGILFYSDLKRYLEIYADQKCVIQMNGDTSQINVVSPMRAGSLSTPARFVKDGPVWSLNVVNKSQQTLNLICISAE